MNLITQVGTQLSANLPSFVTVSKALTSKPLEDIDAEIPAAYYYLAGIQSEASPYNNATIQPGEYTVAVDLVCQADDLEALFAELRGALAGWQPSGGSWEAMEHVSGDNQGISGGIVWWREMFAARNYQGEV